MEFLATKQGEGEFGIKNTGKSASPGGLWAVYWFAHDFTIIIIIILFAYMSHRVTHGPPYLVREIALFAWQGQCVATPHNLSSSASS